MDFNSLVSRLAVRMAAELNIREDEDGPEADFHLKVDDRGQDVTIYPAAQEDREFLRVVTRVGESTQMTPERLRQFLNLNGSLSYGAFALMEGYLVVTACLEADPLDEAKAARAISHMARTADQMERAFFGTDRA